MHDIVLVQIRQCLTNIRSHAGNEIQRSRRARRERADAFTQRPAVEVIEQQRFRSIHIRLGEPDKPVPSPKLAENSTFLRVTKQKVLAVTKVRPDAFQDGQLTRRPLDEQDVVRRAVARQHAKDCASGQVVRNFSRATSAMVTSSPSRSLRCSPRSNGLSLSDVPFKLESTMK